MKGAINFLQANSYAIKDRSIPTVKQTVLFLKTENGEKSLEVTKDVVIDLVKDKKHKVKHLKVLNLLQIIQKS